MHYDNNRNLTSIKPCLNLKKIKSLESNEKTHWFNFIFYKKVLSTNKKLKAEFAHTDRSKRTSLQ